MKKKWPILLLLTLVTGFTRAQNTMMNQLHQNSAGPHQYTSPEEIAYYKQLADDGNIQAMGYLGDMYFYGEGTVPKNCSLSVKYYQMAVMRGDSSSMLSLGNAYMEGVCVEQDFQKAENLYLLASGKGVSPAMTSIGMMYEMGRGKPADYDKAWEWYLKTAENPVEIFYGEGSRAYGGYQVIAWLTEASRNFYETDSLKKKYHPIDTLRTFNAFKEAAEKGNKFAMMALASAYMSGASTLQDTAKTRYWLLKAAAAGDAPAMYSLAIMYDPLGDYDGPHDFPTAAKWFLKAAEAGYIDGMTHTAIVYYHGRGVPQDYVKAREWFIKAAAKGDALAMNDLGLIYMNGLGIPADTAKAFDWFSKAAKLDYGNSMFYVGFLYDIGGGTMQDYKKAMEWYLKAARKGNNYAYEAIGKLYEDGKGVPQDYKKAVEWYSKVHH